MTKGGQVTGDANFDKLAELTQRETVFEIVAVLTGGQQVVIPILAAP